jgi:hypothetical protein
MHGSNYRPYDLVSPCLEYIDVSEFAKFARIKSINCPALKTIILSNGEYLLNMFVTKSVDEEPHYQRPFYEYGGPHGPNYSFPSATHKHKNLKQCLYYPRNDNYSSFSRVKCGFLHPDCTIEVIDDCNEEGD